MAKVVGLVGSASGKIGNMVYAVINGVQIARVYQPQVTNPKSTLQNLQRAKGNLTGRISSFVPRTCLYGLGVNNRSRRSEFLRILLRGATAANVSGEYTAKIADEDVVFSKGAVSNIWITPTFNAGANSLTVTLTAPSTTLVPSEVYNAYQSRIVAMIYDNTTQELVEVVTKMVDKPAQGSAGPTNLQIAYPEGYVAVVYIIPMSTSDNTRINITTDIAMLDDNDIVALLTANRNAFTFVYGRSRVIGKATYTPGNKIMTSKERVKKNEIL